MRRLTELAGYGLLVGLAYDSSVRLGTAVTAVLLIAWSNFGAKPSNLGS